MAKIIYCIKCGQKVVDGEYTFVSKINGKSIKIFRTYTNYEGTQLQRNLERAIREQKDIQIFAKASGNNELIADSQSKITQLTSKYRELSSVSNLPTKMQRMKVSGYRRTKVK